MILSVFVGVITVFVVITTNTVIAVVTTINPVGYKHTRDEILVGALETAFEHGFNRLTFGRVASHLDINDRTVVYYFPTKSDLITGVLMAMGEQLMTSLAPALESGGEPAEGHLDLVRAAWPVLAKPETDPVFSLFFEANGLAAAGQEPYRTMVPQLVQGWVDWSATMLSGGPKARQAEAEAAVALVDGLLLLRQLIGPEGAARAARRLGVA